MGPTRNPTRNTIFTPNNMDSNIMILMYVDKIYILESVTVILPCHFCPLLKFCFVWAQILLADDMFKCRSMHWLRWFEFPAQQLPLFAFQNKSSDFAILASCSCSTLWSIILCQQEPGRWNWAGNWCPISKQSYVKCWN